MHILIVDDEELIRGVIKEYAKKEMIKTDDYRKDLMANVSHDLKTPLTLIKSYAEMVRDISYKDEEKRKKYSVILKDALTKEERVISINNLTDELNILI